MNILVKFIKLNDLMICFFYNLTHIYDEIIDIDSFLELIKLGLKISFNYSWSYWIALEFKLTVFYLGTLFIGCSCVYMSISKK